MPDLNDEVKAQIDDILAVSEAKRFPLWRLINKLGQLYEDGSLYHVVVVMVLSDGTVSVGCDAVSRATRVLLLEKGKELTLSKAGDDDFLDLQPRVEEKTPCIDDDEEEEANSEWLIRLEEE